MIGSIECIVQSVKDINETIVFYVNIFTQHQLAIFYRKTLSKKK